jgi:hypothetical protein
MNWVTISTLKLFNIITLFDIYNHVGNECNHW